MRTTAILISLLRHYLYVATHSSSLFHCNPYFYAILSNLHDCLIFYSAGICTMRAGVSIINLPCTFSDTKSFDTTVQRPINHLQPCEFPMFLLPPKREGQLSHLLFPTLRERLCFLKTGFEPVIICL